MSVGYQLRAPWYVRERGRFDMLDPRARRPSIQMYDSPEFVTQLKADPRVSLASSVDDTWSYPVPIRPKVTAKGRDRFVTSKLVHTQLRKLYQPSHSRFYVVVVEVFCDAPGLPRAGSHNDIEVSFVMRRQHTSIAGDRVKLRALARRLMDGLARSEPQLDSAATPDDDVGDLWFTSEAARIRFEEDNAGLLDELEARTEEQAWMVDLTGGRWRSAETPPAPVLPDKEHEERLPMWRLPPRKDDCEAAKTRSLWFGLVPTYSGEHWTDAGTLKTKLDDHEIYQLRCLVTRPPDPGHEHCPPTIDVSFPTEPFSLAAAFDPDGTKNHTVSITAPDLRRLAARAAGKQGPGGLRITTPPNSGLGPVDFKKIPGAGIGTVGAGGSICTFAFELFFIVAFFLFLLFLPIVVLAFQLWWMLALRFCIPPSFSFTALATFFAGANHDLAKLANSAAVPGPGNIFRDTSDRLDEVIGVGGAAAALLTAGARPPLPNDFVDNPGKIVDLVAGIDPKDAQLTPAPPKYEPSQPDPLCPERYDPAGA